MSFRIPYLAILVLSLVDPCFAQKEWQVLDGCRLIEHPSNDGDSFRVHWQDMEFVIRIYFADTPEQNFNYQDRIQAQADYFGITTDQAHTVGHMATEFTHEQLRSGFTIKTRWQDVYSTAKVKRKYGFVEVGGRDLAELLVENGLARVHGVGVKGLTREEVKRLKELELVAKSNGRGAWGITEQ